MLGNKRQREEEKLDENIIKSKNNSFEKKNFNANFLMKLYQILETPELSSIIEWGENGKFFKVKNITEFTEKVLPKFFKHNNFASFVRQVIQFFPIFTNFIFKLRFFQYRNTLIFTKILNFYHNFQLQIHQKKFLYPYRVI